MIGAILIDPDALARVAPIVTAQDFYRADHRETYRAALAVHEAGDAPDLVTVRARLDATGKLEEAGGLAYLGELAHNTPSSANVAGWAELIAQASQRRRLIALGADLMERAREPGADAADLAARMVDGARDIARGTGAVHTPPEVDDFLALEFPPQEPLCGPIRCQQGVLVAAAPGVGKTHLLVGMAHALTSGVDFMHWRVPTARSVLLVDGELPASELQERLRHYRWSGGSGGLRVVNATNWVSSCGLSHPNIADLEWQARVNEWAEGADVIMLDNVMSLLSVPGVSMSDDAFWKPAHDFTLRQRAAGRTVIWADHLNAQGKVFGTKTKEWAADLVFTLEKPADHVATDGCVFTVTFTKTRGLYGGAVTPFEARLLTGPDGAPCWSYRQQEDAHREQAWEYSREGMTQREIAAEMKISLGRVNKLLKEAREVHGG